MLLAGVLKVLIGLSALSQYKLWTLGHEHNSSSAWFLNFGPPENGDQDTLETWLFGPVKNVPINGLDCPLRWLYGPFLTQRPPQEPVEVKDQVPTLVPNSVSEHVHEQVDPEIEVKDPHDNWVHGPNPDYLVNSGSEGNGPKLGDYTRKFYNESHLSLLYHGYIDRLAVCSGIWTQFCPKITDHDITLAKQLIHHR